MKRLSRVGALVAGALLLLPVAASGHPAPGGQLVPNWLTKPPDRLQAKHTPGPAKPSRGVELIAHHNPGGFNADVVEHDGYAYLGSWGTSSDDDSLCPAQGVRVYDLDRLSRPRIVSTFADGVSNPMLEASWTEKIQVRRVHTRSFKGDLAAVSLQPCEAGGVGGIALYDVTNPRHPRELAVFENGIQGVHELWMQVRGKRVYVYQATIFEEIFQFFGGLEPGQPRLPRDRCSDPRNPEQVGQWGAWEELDIVPTAANGSFPFNFVHSMIGNEDGDRVYLSYWDIGTVILDMSDPTDARSWGGRASDRTRRATRTPRGWPIGSGILIENPGGLGSDDDAGHRERLRLYADLRHPQGVPAQALTEFRMPSQPAPPGPGDFTVHDPKVRGDTLYMSHYAEGVVVLDIERPSRPRQIAQFVPPPAGDPFGFWFDGVPAPHVWGVWVEKDHVLASDINSGLWIFRTRGR